MKKIILTSTIIMAMLFGYAGEEGYMQKMQKNINALEETSNPETCLEIAQHFEKIAGQESEKWLPNYYVAYAYLNYVFSDESANIDHHLDKAQKHLDRARELSNDNSEIEALQGWLYQGRIQADPAKRGMEYSQKAAASFGKAKNLDPGNPRVYFLQGMNVMYTPEQYGGGKKAACPIFSEAKEKYASFKPETPISPDWGKEFVEQLVADCNE